MVPPFPETSSKTFWDSRPRRCLPCHPSTPPHLSLRCAGFGSGYPVTPLLGPFCTPDSEPVPAASPGKSTPVPSSDVCRLCCPGHQLPSMADKTYPQFLDVYTQYQLVKEIWQCVERSMETHRISGGYHPVVRVKKYCLHRQLCMCPFRLPSPVVLSPDHTYRRCLPYLVVLATFPHLPVSPATIESQWLTTASTTKLNTMGNSGSPCVTPISP